MYISTLKSYFCKGTSTGKCDLVMNADFLPRIFVSTVFCVICHITVDICSQYVGLCTVHRTLHILKNLNSDLNLAIQQIQYWPTFCLLVHYSIYAGNNFNFFVLLRTLHATFREFALRNFCDKSLNPMVWRDCLTRWIWFLMTCVVSFMPK